MLLIWSLIYHKSLRRAALRKFKLRFKWKSYLLRIDNLIFTVKYISVLIVYDFIVKLLTKGYPNLHRYKYYWKENINWDSRAKFTVKIACYSRVTCITVPCHFLEITTTLNNYMAGLVIAQAIGHAHGHVHVNSTLILLYSLRIDNLCDSIINVIEYLCETQ